MFSIVSVLDPEVSANSLGCVMVHPSTIRPCSTNMRWVLCDNLRTAERPLDAHPSCIRQHTPRSVQLIYSYCKIRIITRSSFRAGHAGIVHGELGCGHVQYPHVSDTIDLFLRFASLPFFDCSKHNNTCFMHSRKTLNQTWSKPTIILHRG